MQREVTAVFLVLARAYPLLAWVFLSHLPEGENAQHLSEYLIEWRGLLQRAGLPVIV